MKKKKHITQPLINKPVNKPLTNKRISTSFQLLYSQ